MRVDREHCCSQTYLYKTNLTCRIPDFCLIKTWRESFINTVMTPYRRRKEKRQTPGGGLMVWHVLVGILLNNTNASGFVHEYRIAE